MKRNLILRAVLSALPALTASAQMSAWHFEFSGGKPDKLVWQADAGRDYDLFQSPDLAAWTHVEGFPKPGPDPAMEHPFVAETLGFFKVTSAKSPSAEFVLIPAGTFSMGDSLLEGYSWERPVHSVYVSAFHMAKYEVTKALWDEVRRWAVVNGYTDLAAGSSFAGNSYSKGPGHPVHMVTWYDVVKWCNASSEKEGLVPCYYTDAAQTMLFKAGTNAIENTMVNWSANGYRLPTEAEWEKAARGGVAGARYPWGTNTISHAQSNYYATGTAYGNQSGNAGNHPDYATGASPYTAPAGSFAATGYGLHDMAGNVWEWCWDRYGEYPSALRTNPRGATSGAFRVRRGGAWLSVAEVCSVALRWGSDPSSVYFSVGFRVARSSVP